MAETRKKFNQDFLEGAGGWPRRPQADRASCHGPRINEGTWPTGWTPKSAVTRRPRSRSSRVWRCRSGERCLDIPTFDSPANTRTPTSGLAEDAAARMGKAAPSASVGARRSSGRPAMAETAA